MCDLYKCVYIHKIKNGWTSKGGGGCGCVYRASLWKLLACQTYISIWSAASIYIQLFIWPLVVSSLQSLDMAGNQLTSIPSGLPESLEYLYLQNNKITMISENAFESTPKIKGIYLR